MLGRDFIKINGVRVPTPASYTESFDNIEEINQSERGTDRTLVTRLQKVSINLSFDVTDYWKEKLLAYGKLPTCNLQVGSASSMSGRFRVSNSPMVRNSNNATVTLWTVNATFTQI